MPTRKISDLPMSERTCYDPDHEPPSMMVYEDGVYEHTCPSCGRTITFTVRKPTFSVGGIRPTNWHFRGDL